jgi:hypothetical protein
MPFAKLFSSCFSTTKFDESEETFEYAEKACRPALRAVDTSQRLAHLRELIDDEKLDV